MDHTDKKPETEARRLGQQMQEGFNLPKDTFTWVWPRKPMSGKIGQSVKGGKTVGKPSKPAVKTKSVKSSKKSPFPGW